MSAESVYAVRELIYRSIQGRQSELVRSGLAKASSRGFCVGSALHKNCFLIRFFVQMCSKFGADLVWVLLVEPVSIVTYRVCFYA